MNLHRSGPQPDWTNQPPSQHNRWQIWAAQTGGLATPGNFISLTGLTLVFIGLGFLSLRAYWFAITLIIIGRLCDLADGWIADLTHTKSPLGETIDATVDKVATFATLMGLALFHLISWWLALILCAPQIAIIVVSRQAKRKGRRLHPSRLGKTSLATTWIALVGFVAAPLVPLPITPVLTAIAFIAITLSLTAFAQYSRGLLRL